MKQPAIISSLNILPAMLHQHHDNDRGSLGFYRSKTEWHGMEKCSRLFSLGQTITLQMYLERSKVWAEQT